MNYLALDEKALEIISHARQKNVARRERPLRDFEAIFADFFPNERAAHLFAGKRVLDLGPGQCHFSLFAMHHGAAEVHGIDNDPAVIALGRHLGCTMHEGNLRGIDYAQMRGAFDGVFCKLSMNVFWFPTPDELREHLEDVLGLLRADGWGWIAPWNGLPQMREAPKDPAAMLRVQREVFIEHGWQAFELSDPQVRRYGLSGAIDNHPLFMRGLAIPADLREAL